MQGLQFFRLHLPLLKPAQMFPGFHLKDWTENECYEPGIFQRLIVCQTFQPLPFCLLQTALINLLSV